MGAEIEMVLCRMSDVGIHGGSCMNLPCPARLVPLVRAEPPGVVSLLFHDEGDAGPVVSLQFPACLSDGQLLKHPVWPEPCLLPGPLYPDHGTVGRGDEHR